MRSCILVGLVSLLAMGAPLTAAAQPCGEEPLHKNYDGVGQVTCPCFVDGEMAGTVFDVPAEHYPIEILRIGVGWGSQAGGMPTSLEQAIHVFGGGLPSPTGPLFTLGGPQLTDGAINEFDLEPLPGEVIVDSGPFTVALEFANSNLGSAQPSTIHDGNGCQPGKNVIYAIPGGWMDACSAGVTGDWVFTVVYKRANCSVPVYMISIGDLKSRFR